MGCGRAWSAHSLLSPPVTASEQPVLSSSMMRRPDQALSRYKYPLDDFYSERDIAIYDNRSFLRLTSERTWLRLLEEPLSPLFLRLSCRPSNSFATVVKRAHSCTKHSTGRDGHGERPRYERNAQRLQPTCTVHARTSNSRQESCCTTTRHTVQGIICLPIVRHRGFCECEGRSHSSCRQ